MLSVDGASNKKGSGVGVILEGLNDIIIEQFLHFEFRASKNQVEYKALLVRMILAEELGAQILVTKSDSQLVTGQDKAQSQAASFERFTLIHIPREKNERTNLLSKLASTQKSEFNRSVIQEALNQPTIETRELSCATNTTSWVDLIISYLQNDEVPTEHKEARKLRREASKYTLIAKQLYKHGFSYPLLKCLNDKEARYVIKEVHEGYGIKQSFTSVEHPQMNDKAELANKVILRGLRRLTIKTDAVIPVERKELSPKTLFFQSALNEEAIRENMDLLQEDREVAKVRASQRNDAKIYPKELKKHDLVLAFLLKSKVKLKKQLKRLLRDSRSVTAYGTIKKTRESDSSPTYFLRQLPNIRPLPTEGLHNQGLEVAGITPVVDVEVDTRDRWSQLTTTTASGSCSVLSKMASVPASPDNLLLKTGRDSQTLVLRSLELE
ncbi:hypothetical protein CR513_20774, partial [Mucuna pruriens]